MSQNQLNEELTATRTGQVFEEYLIFERSEEGLTGSSLPSDDSNLSLDLDDELIRDDLRLPEVSEPEVVRHYTRLSTWNYGIDLNFYPLGSCTMKYNPRINEEVASIPAYRDLHPSMPQQYSRHAIKVIYDLQDLLCKITDMPGITLQPAAGAHGELTGLFLFRAYHKAKGNSHKKTILVPDSAHGTNPATCTLAGYNVVELKSTPDGLMDMDALKEKLTDDVAGLMITNPNTVGVFEPNIRKIAELLHEIDALVYMDGANYNAIVGQVSLGEMGIDASHLNLHKTFSTPHGGGGPGGAAVVVSDRLKHFLPGPVAVKNGDQYSFENPAQSIGRVKAGPGHFGVLLRACTYILTYGNQIGRIAEHAVLNANIMREALEDAFQVASSKDSMHEVVFSNAKQKDTGYDTMHLAKALIDYGYHPPTVYFPLSVPGSIMIEPTETESPRAIDKFAEVMKDIARRMQTDDESLKTAPHRSIVTRIDEADAARNPNLNYFTAK